MFLLGWFLARLKFGRRLEDRGRRIDTIGWMNQFDGSLFGRLWLLFWLFQEGSRHGKIRRSRGSVGIVVVGSSLRLGWWRLVVMMMQGNHVLRRFGQGGGCRVVVGRIFVEQGGQGKRRWVRHYGSFGGTCRR